MNQGPGCHDRTLGGVAPDTVSAGHGMCWSSWRVSRPRLARQPTAAPTATCAACSARGPRGPVGRAHPNALPTLNPSLCGGLLFVLPFFRVKKGLSPAASPAARRRRCIIATPSPAAGQGRQGWAAAYLGRYPAAPPICCQAEGRSGRDSERSQPGAPTQGCGPCGQRLAGRSLAQPGLAQRVPTLAAPLAALPRRRRPATSRR